MNNKKTKTRIISLAIIYSVVSCSVMEESQDPIINSRDNPMEERAITKSAPIQEDSLQRVVDYQKNTTVMLLNLIQEVDGQYILDLSPSDASTLGIPDSLFLWAKYCVSCMNEK